jgi:hypothetical protein
VRHGLARSLSQGEKASGDLKTEKGEVEKNVGTLLLLPDEMLAHPPGFIAQATRAEIDCALFTSPFFYGFGGPAQRLECRS